MLTQLQKLRKWFRRVFLGWRDCPICGHQSVRWIKDPLFHPDEPPILGHWQCFMPRCRARDETRSTPWADEIAQEYGYSTYKQALEDIASRRNKEPH